MVDISNGLYIIIVLVLLVIFWNTSEVIIAQVVGTVLILAQFGLIYYYGRRVTQLDASLESKQ
jgi:hypothetical protein